MPLGGARVSTVIFTLKSAVLDFNLTPESIILTSVSSNSCPRLQGNNNQAKDDLVRADEQGFVVFLVPELSYSLFKV